jgi:hypothetical protein
MRLMPPKWASDCIEGAKKDPPEKLVLFFDELTGCAPSTQSAMLRVLSEKAVGDVQLPDDVIMCAACNPPGVAAGGFELEAPMSNRLCWVRWETPWKEWETGMLDGGRFPDPVIPILPENWRDLIPEVAAMVVAFRKLKPGLFSPDQDSHGNMEMSQSERSGAWGSMRSWTSGAYCMAAAKSTAGDDTLMLNLLSGCVGESRGLEFFEWQRNLDLPDPEEMLQHFMTAKKPKYNHPDRPDKTIAMMSSLSAAVRRTPTVPRWHAALAIVKAACGYEMDVALSGAASIITMLRDNKEFLDAGIPDDLKELVLPAIVKMRGQRAGA